MFSSFLKRFRQSSRLPRHLDPPTGSYDLLGTRCVGTVNTMDGPVGEVFRLVLRRSSYILADFETEPTDAQNRAPFAIDIGGIVSAEELLRESVELVAFDQDGNEGRLTLKGATQVEMIQRHMGTPQDIILDLDFSEGGNAEALLGEGWSVPEAGWRWSSGEASAFTFEHPVQGGNYEVTVLGQPFLCPPKLLEQRIEYYIGDELVLAASKDISTGELTRFKVPGAVFETPGPKTMRLCHPDAARPSDLMDVQDARQLAVAYKKLVIARLKPTV